MKSLVRLTAAVIALCLTGTAFAAASILVWPIDPVIEHDDSGAAIWLENNGKSASRIQIRALRWTQANGADELVAQDSIVVSPPAAEIQPGQRQLLRLIRTVAVPPGKQEAYRILIDEIPGDSGAAPAGDGSGRHGQAPQAAADGGGSGRHGQAPQAAADGGAGLAFQLRYSVPLFVSGEGAWTREDLRKHPDPKTAAQPVLTYSVQNKAGQRWLVVRNSGAVHARLSQVGYTLAGREVWTVPGLLGYVLPGAEMRFEVPAAVQAGGVLKAHVNADREARVIAPR
ncbi:fimbrial biogenesis chaperone [Achromobacter sp.]|uniref:fimbrial biogenesis chaperone n=1 Tax=Achromobacter sp. TaxID=134375 RepID=UPI003D002B2A